MLLNLTFALDDCNKSGLLRLILPSVSVNEERISIVMI